MLVRPVARCPLPFFFSSWTCQEKIRDYESMFEQLKKMTGTDRLEEVRNIPPCVREYTFFFIFHLLVPFSSFHGRSW